MDTKCFTPCSRIRVVEGGCRCYNDFTPEDRDSIHIIRSKISLITNSRLDKITIRYTSEGGIEIYPTGTDPDKGSRFCSDDKDLSDNDVIEIAEHINKYYRLWL